MNIQSAKQIKDKIFPLKKIVDPWTLKMNAKAAAQKVFKQAIFRPIKSTTRPSHLKKYPNMTFNRTRIINFVYRAKGKLDFSEVASLPQKLNFVKIRAESKVKQVMPPQHDFINFKNMCGNEILLNMTNYEHFRNGELINCFYEFSKRVNLPENKDITLVKDSKWIAHPFVKPLYNRVVFYLPRLNLKHLIVTLLAFDNLKINDEIKTWRKMEESIDRLLHKLKPTEIILLLEQLNKHTNRSSKEFLNKLLTIIPIHVEALKDEELLTLVKVCIKQDLVNERLFAYFIYPRLEQRMKRFKLCNYFRGLGLLCDLHYQEDLEFWNAHVLPCIFNYDYSSGQIKNLWEAMLKVKVECPNVDVSRHLLLIENMMKQFENMNESGQDISGILLKLEQDMSLVPVKKKTFSFKEAKEAEKRLKDKATLKQFMEKFSAQDNDESRAQEAQLSISKLLEVKDWKKAKYEINLAEMAKMKKLEEDTAAAATIDTPATPVTPATSATSDDEVKTAETISVNEEETSPKVDGKEDEYNAFNMKYLAKQARKSKNKNKKDE